MLRRRVSRTTSSRDLGNTSAEAIRRRLLEVSSGEPLLLSLWTSHQKQQQQQQQQQQRQHNRRHSRHLFDETAATNFIVDSPSRRPPPNTFAPNPLRPARLVGLCLLVVFSVVYLFLQRQAVRRRRRRIKHRAEVAQSNPTLQPHGFGGNDGECLGDERSQHSQSCHDDKKQETTVQQTQQQNYEDIFNSADESSWIREMADREEEMHASRRRIRRLSAITEGDNEQSSRSLKSNLLALSSSFRLRNNKSDSKRRLDSHRSVQQQSSNSSSSNNNSKGSENGVDHTYSSSTTTDRGAPLAVFLPSSSMQLSSSPANDDDLVENHNCSRNDDHNENHIGSSQHSDQCTFWSAREDDMMEETGQMKASLNYCDAAQQKQQQENEEAQPPAIDPSPSWTSAASQFIYSLARATSASAVAAASVASVASAGAPETTAVVAGSDGGDLAKADGHQVDVMAMAYFGTTEHEDGDASPADVDPSVAVARHFMGPSVGECDDSHASISKDEEEGDDDDYGNDDMTTPSTDAVRSVKNTSQRSIGYHFKRNTDACVTASPQFSKVQRETASTTSSRTTESNIPAASAESQQEEFARRPSEEERQEAQTEGSGATSANHCQTEEREGASLRDVLTGLWQAATTTTMHS